MIADNNMRAKTQHVLDTAQLAETEQLFLHVLVSLKHVPDK